MVILPIEMTVGHATITGSHTHRQTSKPKRRKASSVDNLTLLMRQIPSYLEGVHNESKQSRSG